MPIVVKVPTQLRTFTAGRACVTADGETVSEALANLGRNHPGVLQRIVDDEGAIRRFVNIYVDEENVRFLEGLDTKLDEGNVLAIIPAVAGGSR